MNRAAIRLNPKRAIEAAVLNCVADVFASDVLGGSEIGDGARHFKNTIVGARTKIQFGQALQKLARLTPSFLARLGGARK